MKQAPFGTNLSLADFRAIINNRATTYEYTQNGTTTVRCFESDQAVIYGLNTGFGPMAHMYIGHADQTQLQYNLLRSHATGLGSTLAEADCRAILAARLQTLCLGYSAVSELVLQTLLTMLNNTIAPAIPEHGSVGASGDLVQLAHLGLCVIGEGEVWCNNRRQLTADVFKEYNIPPATLQGRDGLALINGTAAMTGIAARNTYFARHITQVSTIHSAILYELLEVHQSIFTTLVSDVRPHKGQRLCVETLNQYLQRSSHIQTTTPTRGIEITDQTTAMSDNPQELYSLRCVPQILGPIYDAVERAEQTVTTELNSVTDNPIFTAETYFHNGNFHGDYIAYEMDCLKIAMTKVSQLAERQLHHLLHPRLNQQLPAFLNRGTLGVNLGLQGMQFTATSTVAENQTLATPVSVHTIPTNGDNQDMVSMGTNSALMCRTVIENTYQVLAIQAISLIQAARILNKHASFCTDLQTYVNTIANIVPETTDDIVWYQIQNQVLQTLKSYPQTNVR